MAGITRYPFRALCRGFGAGLYVSEMVTARPLAEGHAVSQRIAAFGPEEAPRSLQLYGVDPAHVRAAVAWLVDAGRIDHLDLNFGCPAPKITRKGGGAALPLRPRLFQAIVRAAVEAAGPVPVTVKMRTGLSDGHRTFLDAGRIARDEGVAAVCLHARTAAQLYSGRADWADIARLKEALPETPVLGNGDIFEAGDALAMMRTTGCDGVTVGRGCLGRPWLFRELAAAFDGRPPPPPPRLGEVVQVALDHASRLVDWMGEVQALRDFRKHVGWYLLGFPVAAPVRAALLRAERLSELATLLESLPTGVAFPAGAARVPRGKSGAPLRVSVPQGWLDDPLDATPPGPEAELAVSGG